MQMAYDGPEVKIEEVSVRKASLNLSHVERFLCIAVGFDPKRTKMQRVDNPQTFELVEETTGFMKILDANFNTDPDREPPFIDTLLLQLKEWDASPRDGNLVARRAWELIEYYQRQLEKTQNDASGWVNTGCFDKHGKEIKLGDRVRYNLEGPGTQREYWNPEYIVIWEAPMFTLKHVGGGKSGDGDSLFKLKHGGRNGQLEIIPPSETANEMSKRAEAIREEHRSRGGGNPEDEIPS